MVTGGSAGVVVAAMALSGAIGSFLGDVAEGKISGETKNLGEMCINAVWGAGFGALGGYMNGKMASNIGRLKNLGFATFVDRMTTEEAEEIGANITKEVLTNYGTTVFRAIVEFWPKFLAGEITVEAR